jgi:hypothetical protein
VSSSIHGLKFGRIFFLKLLTKFILIKSTIAVDIKFEIEITERCVKSPVLPTQKKDRAVEQGDTAEHKTEIRIETKRQIDDANDNSLVNIKNASFTKIVFNKCYACLLA